MCESDGCDGMMSTDNRIIRRDRFVDESYIEELGSQQRQER